MTSGVHVLSDYLDPGSTGLGTFLGPDVPDHGVDEAVLGGGDPSKVLDFDDDRTLARLLDPGSVDFADDFLCLLVEVLVGVALDSGNLEAKPKTINIGFQVLFMSV